MRNSQRPNPQTALNEIKIKNLIAGHQGGSVRRFYRPGFIYKQLQTKQLKTKQKAGNQTKGGVFRKYTRSSLQIKQKKINF